MIPFNDPIFTPAPGKEFPRGYRLVLEYPIDGPVQATLLQTLAVIIQSTDGTARLIQTSGIPDATISIPPVNMGQEIDLIDVTTNTPIGAKMSVGQIFLAVTSLARFIQINNMEPRTT